MQEELEVLLSKWNYRTMQSMTLKNLKSFEPVVFCPGLGTSRLGLAWRTLWEPGWVELREPLWDNDLDSVVMSCFREIDDQKMSIDI